MASAAPKPRIPVEKRGKIIGLREMGLTYREIAARVGCSVGSVCELIKKHQQTGTAADRPIPGRKIATTNREDHVYPWQIGAKRLLRSVPVSKNIIAQPCQCPQCSDDCGRWV